MDYDDHEYCDRCDRHTTDCWCFTGRGSGWPLPAEDEVCRTPHDKCTHTRPDVADPNEGP